MSYNNPCLDLEIKLAANIKKLTDSVKGSNDPFFNALKNQIARSITSIPLNTAESEIVLGTERQRISKLQIANGELNESQASLRILIEMGFIDGNDPLAKECISDMAAIRAILSKSLNTLYNKSRRREE